MVAAIAMVAVTAASLADQSTGAMRLFHCLPALGNTTRANTSRGPSAEAKRLDNLTETHTQPPQTQGAKLVGAVRCGG